MSDDEVDGVDDGDDDDDDDDDTYINCEWKQETILLVYLSCILQVNYSYASFRMRKQKAMKIRIPSPIASSRKATKKW